MYFVIGQTEPVHEVLVLIAYVSSKDSDRNAHPGSLLTHSNQGHS